MPAAYATGAGALLLQLLVLAWLLALVLAAFKPDVDRLPGGVGAWLLAVPMQVMMWLLLVLAGFGAELLWIAQGTHPNNLASAPAGSAKQADNAEGADLIVAGLANSAHPDAPLGREQAAISDIGTFGVTIPKSPAWHELSNRAPMEFDDEARRIRWVFSHDLGKFVGYGLADRQRVGELGVDDNEPALTASEKRATVADLLKSRSGVYHPALYETPAMAAARPARGSHAPGSFWYYNNWDFNAAGEIYRRCTGRGIHEAFLEDIARPLGMLDYQGRIVAWPDEGQSFPDDVDGFRQLETDKSRFAA